jgi:hypothetical protein
MLDRTYVILRVHRMTADLRGCGLSRVWFLPTWRRTGWRSSRSGSVLLDRVSTTRGIRPEFLPTHSRRRWVSLQVKAHFQRTRRRKSRLDDPTAPRGIHAATRRCRRSRCRSRVRDMVDAAMLDGLAAIRVSTAIAVASVLCRSVEVSHGIRPPSSVAGLQPGCVPAAVHRRRAQRPAGSSTHPRVRTEAGRPFHCHSPRRAWSKRAVPSLTCGRRGSRIRKPSTTIAGPVRSRAGHPLAGECIVNPARSWSKTRMGQGEEPRGHRRPCDPPVFTWCSRRPSSPD